MMPFSVIMDVIRSGGVISNAGFITFILVGAIFFFPIFVTSSLERSSITISSISFFKSKCR